MADSRKKILLQVSIIEKDMEFCAGPLFESLKRFVEGVNAQVLVFFVYQTQGNQGPAHPWLRSDFVKLHVTKHFSVSSARNKGLAFAREYGFDYIVFHDAATFVSDPFIQLVNLTLASDLDISMGALVWSSSLPEPTAPITSLDERRTYPVIMHCVCTYVFKVALLENIQFNERLGPGEGTVLKAGEDVVFLTEVLRARGSDRLPYSAAAMVCHPPRPADNSKHLLYAEGQGVILRWLIKPKNITWFNLFYFFAFFGNALFKLLLARKHAGRILALRLRGFMDSANRRSSLDSPKTTAVD